MKEDYELKTLAKFGNEQQAHLLRGELNNQGIPAVVAGDNPWGITGGNARMLRAFHVSVRKIDYDRARQVMEELQAASEREKSPAWRCQCGAQVDEGFLVCWSCGQEWLGE